jgi:hypothetical protein
LFGSWLGGGESHLLALGLGGVLSRHDGRVMFRKIGLIRLWDVLNCMLWDLRLRMWFEGVRERGREGKGRGWPGRDEAGGKSGTLLCPLCFVVVSHVCGERDGPIDWRRWGKAVGWVHARTHGSLVSLELPCQAK